MTIIAGESVKFELLVDGSWQDISDAARPVEISTTPDARELPKWEPVSMTVQIKEWHERYKVANGEFISVKPRWEQWAIQWNP